MFRPGAALNYDLLYTNYVTAVYLREVVFAEILHCRKAFCIARCSDPEKAKKTISDNAIFENA
jgi:hypothetical protein